jgi:flagellar hook-length control protein FliK
LSETSDPATDDVVAIPTPGGEVSEASPDRTGETSNTGQPTDAVAQETYGDAQVLSQTLPVITTATGPTPTPEPTVNPDPSPIPVAPTPPPTVQDQPQLQPNPTSNPPSVAPVVEDGKATTPETGRDAQSGDSENRQGAPPPATGRAIQVQTGVAVQNATGQAPLPASGGAPTGVPIATPANVDLGLEDAPNNTSARVVRGLTAMLNQRGGVMTMRLDPPSLGQLRVQMTVARGVVTAQFQPATLEAQALLERSLATLRISLESQGLTVERLTVHAAPATTAGREAAEDQSQQQQQQASRHQPDAGHGRSRGRGDEQPRDGRHGRRGTTHFADAFENIGAKAA